LKFANYYEIIAFDADHLLTGVVLLRELGRSTVKIFSHSALPEAFCNLALHYAQLFAQTYRPSSHV